MIQKYGERDREGRVIDGSKKENLNQRMTPNTEDTNIYFFI